MKYLLPALIVLGLCGCTSVNVKPMDPSIKLQYVCIQKNPRVKVSDFLQVLKDGLSRHGVASEVFEEKAPDKCEYVLTYTALRSWDVKPYLSQAELRIEKRGKEIASVEYKHAGGFSLDKFQGTKEKMDPVIDRLLAAR